MFYKKIILFVLLWLVAKNMVAQSTCNELGQNPATAFPVCGTDTFSIKSVPICGDHPLPSPCTSVPVSDINPFWYRFTCFKAGSLGFLIKPNTIDDDYDWQLFDITDHNPEDVFTNASLFVSCNWSGEYGLTGASSAGTQLSVCPSETGAPYRPLFSRMPVLKLAHTYLLLVSHFSDTQSGYSLSFGGGTASIVDPINPAMLKARAPCDGTKMTVKLNKKMKCSSLAADGSDFTISPAIAPIISATAVGCTRGFDMDSVEITLGGKIPPGNYNIGVQTGTDGNNLLDNCDRSIPAGQTIPVTVYPVVATPMDSLTKPGCAPVMLELIFKSPMFCSSIAADGSDFIVTGTSGITVAAASGSCGTGELTYSVQVRLSAPIEQAGSFQIILQKGTDGNTLLNECGAETPAGSFKTFTTIDTVSALFTTSVLYGCTADKITYSNEGRNNINNWNWTFDNGFSSRAKDTSLTWKTEGEKKATLIVSNGTCSDTTSVTTLLESWVKASFESTVNVCPGDPVTFKDKSAGPVAAWIWNFGNGNSSMLQSPANQYYVASNAPRHVAAQLIVKNNIGCADTVTNDIYVLSNCYIAVPKAFSPNNDGLNDFLFPNNAYKATDLSFRIYNRAGQLIFETRDWTHKWDGTYKGNPQDPGAYVWILSYTNIDTGERYNLKGSTVLIR